MGTYRQAIVHGALNDLMRMPDRRWTDLKSAEYHGRQWTYLLNSAKADANRSFGDSSLRVDMCAW